MAIDDDADDDVGVDSDNNGDVTDDVALPARDGGKGATRFDVDGAGTNDDAASACVTPLPQCHIVTPFILPFFLPFSFLSLLTLFTSCFATSFFGCANTSACSNICIAPCHRDQDATFAVHERRTAARNDIGMTPCTGIEAERTKDDRDDEAGTDGGERSNGGGGCGEEGRGDM